MPRLQKFYRPDSGTTGYRAREVSLCVGMAGCDAGVIGSHTDNANDNWWRPFIFITCFVRLFLNKGRS